MAKLPPELVSLLDSFRDFIDKSVFAYQRKNYCQENPQWPGEVGLEVEMLPVEPQSSLDAPQSFALQRGVNSSAQMLREAAQKFPWKLKTEEHADGSLLTLVTLEDKDLISFEPGGQIEFSSIPYPCLSHAVTRMRTVQKTLDELGEVRGMELIQVGANPWHSVEEVGLQMPKARYKAMDEYFQRIGPHGQQMMRLSCTIQVCLDFGNTEEKLVKRYLAGQLLAPYATATFAYSPFVGGVKTLAKSYRSKIWRNLDSGRTGFPELQVIEKEKTRKVCIDSYFEYAMDAGVVFAERDRFHIPPKGFRFRDWVENGFRGERPTLEDFKTHVSLLFPEVRPRGFLELRSIDSQSRVWQEVPAAYYCGLLYDDDNLDWVLSFLGEDLHSLESILEKAQFGMEDPTMAGRAQKIFQRSVEGLSRLPACFRGESTQGLLSSFGEQFVNRRRTPADDLIDLCGSLSLDRPLLSTFRSLEERWMHSLG